MVSERSEYSLTLHLSTSVRVLTVRLLLVKERFVNRFNASRVVILMSRTGMAVEKREFSKIPNWRHYLLKTRSKSKKNWQNHWEELNKPFRNPSNWVPHELKPRDIERRFFACEQLPLRQNWKGFLHRIMIGDKKWVHYDSPKRIKSWGMPGHASTSKARPNIHGTKVMLCIWWDHLGVMYCELLKPSETITGDRYRMQLMRLSRALKGKRPQYQERHDKVILQHDNAWPHVARPVKTYLETLKWEVLPHPPYFPDVAPSDYHLFRSMAHGLVYQHFRSLWRSQKIDRFVDHHKRRIVFSMMISDNCQKDEKKNSG